MTNGYRAQKQAQTNLSITPMAKGVHQAPGTGTIAFPGEKKNAVHLCYLHHRKKTCVYTHTYMSSVTVDKKQTVNTSEITVESISLTAEFFFFFNQDTHVTEINVCLLSASFSNHDLYPEQCFPREMCAMLEMT